MRSRIQRLLTVVFITLIYTLYKAFQLWPGQMWIAAPLTFLLFFAMIGGMIISRTREDVLHKIWFRILAWSGALAMGLWSVFIFFALLFDVARIAAGLFLLFSGREILSAERIVSILLGILVMSCALAMLGFLPVVRGPRVRKVRAEFKNLVPSLRGFKIAQISDVHVGPTLRGNYVAMIVDRTNQTAPDLIVVTGDLADARATSIAADLEPFRRLHSRFGIFYVTGNHEYYWDVVGHVQKAAELGFTPLINENRILDIAGAKVAIAGITDPMGKIFPGHAPDLVKAAKTMAKTDFKILLSHRPDPHEEAEALGFDLQFSGHTHAGQYFPFSLLIGFFHKYYRGIYRHGGLTVYVNPGTGYWGPPNRLGVPSEITLLTLENSQV